MKPTTYITPNRVDIHTGHATFDRQCDCLMTGNVIANTQLSYYIRPENQLECNGRVHAPGHLREFDLKSFSLPYHVRNAVLEATKDEIAILYEIRHWVGSKRQDNLRKIVHGYILTRGYYENHRFINMFFTNPSNKSRDVIRECVLFICRMSLLPNCNL